MKTSEKIDYNFLIEQHDITKSLRESEISELLMDEENTEDDLDIEDSDLDMIMSIDSEENRPAIEEPMDVVDDSYNTNQSSMQVVSLEDVMTIINNMNQASIEPPASIDTPDLLVISKDAPLEGGEEALMNAFFQSEGNETLDSDFNALKANISNFESHIDPSKSYINVIGSKPIGTNNNSNEFENDIDCTDPRRLVKGLPNSKDFNPDEDLLLDFEYQNDQENLKEDSIEDSQIEYPEGSHPDLYRFGAMNTSVPEEQTEDIIYNAYDLEPEEEELDKPITMNKTMNVAGQQVQIVLTGVIITAPEINYIGETIKRAGIKLLSLVGKNDELNVIVEAEGKEYKINYIDLPKNKSLLPFTMGKNKFSSFEEALDRINYKAAEKENRIFNTLINENLSKRKINEYTDSNIFVNNNVVGKMPAFWTVHPVGFINLKNGMNETYSDITKMNVGNVTLMLNESGDYYMIMGDLKDRSKIGTVRLLTENTGKKNYGNAEVINIYENTIEGLGELMYDIKRTSIPLLVWK